MSFTFHSTYCAATGFQIRATMAHERAWFEFEKAGYTVEDLGLVVAYLRREIKRGNRREGALRFSNLIGLGETAVDRLNLFAEDLALARQAFPSRQQKQQSPISPDVPQPAPAHDPQLSQALTQFRKELRR